mgnify:CR=1 FL=1
MKTRYVAAAFLLVAAAAAADDFARVISSAPVVEPIPGTSSSRIVRYVVTYEFQGKRYTVNLPSDPGPRIRVQGGANYAAPPPTQNAAPAQVVAPSALPVYVPTPPPPAVPVATVPVATVPVPAPVFVTPPPVVYAPPVAYVPPYYPNPYPYVGAYNPIVPFGIGVGVGVLAGGWGGYGWRGGYWRGGGWHR